MSTLVPNEAPPAGHGGAFRHPIRALEGEAHHLLEIERAGDRGETPFLAVAVVMSVVLPIGALMMALAFGAAWLFG
jgi:hypothetical protein